MKEAALYQEKEIRAFIHIWALNVAHLLEIFGNTGCLQVCMLVTHELPDGKGLSVCMRSTYIKLHFRPDTHEYSIGCANTTGHNEIVMLRVVLKI